MSTEGKFEGKADEVKGKLKEGVGDATGNEQEWCEDKWHANYQWAPADGYPWTCSTRIFGFSGWDDMQPPGTVGASCRGIRLRVDPTPGQPVDGLVPFHCRAQG